MRMNLSLFLTISVSSILFLLVFHIIFYGLWYIGLVSRVAGKRPEILTILQNCAVSFEDTFFQKKKIFIPYCILLPLHINLNIMLMSVLLVQVLSIACCVFYSHCGNRAILRERPFVRKNSNWFSLFKKEERNTWLAKFVRMNELKDQVCSSWFAPVGSASDYPLLSKWVIYGEVLLESTIISVDLSLFFWFLSFLLYL